MVSGPHTSYWLTDFRSFPIYPSLPHYRQSLSLILFIASLVSTTTLLCLTWSPESVILISWWAFARLRQDPPLLYSRQSPSSISPLSRLPVNTTTVFRLTWSPDVAFSLVKKLPLVSDPLFPPPSSIHPLIASTIGRRPIVLTPRGL